ncbi:MAG: hypothetical protein R3D01_13340 [Hyphomicrobiales bacterium]
MAAQDSSSFCTYKALSDSGVTAATRDVITHFSPGGTPGGNGEFIDLSAIDAKPATNGIDDDFTFIGANPWGHHAGELRYLFTATQTIVEADINGDAKADFSIALNGHLTLAATDFILTITLTSRCALQYPLLPLSGRFRVLRSRCAIQGKADTSE